MLLEVRRPHHRSGQPHAAVHLGQRVALRGGLYGQLVDPPHLAGGIVAEQPLVDDVARERARGAADDGADRPQKAADSLPGRLKNKRCHQSVTPGKSKIAASRRCQGRESTVSTTRPAES